MGVENLQIDSPVLTRELCWDTSVSICK